MGDWISRWALPEMYAGVQGRGAQDAWYLTAIDLEHAFVATDTPVTGGAVDIYKWFDQIIRPVVYRVASLAGMPRSVLDSYRRYQESLQVRNSISGGRRVYAK